MLGLLVEEAPASSRPSAGDVLTQSRARSLHVTHVSFLEAFGSLIRPRALRGPRAQGTHPEFFPRPSQVSSFSRSRELGDRHPSL